MRSFRIVTAMMACTLGLALASNPAAAQVAADKQAEMLLNTAQKSFNDKNYALAVSKFREYVQKFGGQRQSADARFGLALALMEGPDRNFREARDLLNLLANAKDAPEFPAYLYQLAFANRGLGLQDAALAAARPNEAANHRASANQHFAEAARHFAGAVAAYKARAPAVAANAKELPLDLEWAARSWCDLAEMQLRLNKAREAQKITTPFLKDPALKLSRYRDLGRYYHGFASFLLNEYPAAEKSLSLVAPFADPVFGTHARYLFARTYHLTGAQAEAAIHYEGVLQDYEKLKKNAVEARKRPDLLAKDISEKLRVDDLVKNPPPDHVRRAAFYLGVLQSEAGRFAEAKARFAELVKQFAGSPLEAECKLRLGFCLVHLKEYPEALEILGPIVAVDPHLADQALLWIGKAQLGAAPDPAKNRVGHHQAIGIAIDTLQQAADRAGGLAPQDPQAKERRAACLLEQADAFHLLQKPAEAANRYLMLLNEKALPRRDEELHLRLVDALHLAGNYDESDRQCKAFFDRHVVSILLPAVHFRYGENAYWRMLAADKLPDPNTRAQEVKRAGDEAIQRYQVVIDRFPEFARVNLARYAQAMIYYRNGDLDKTRSILEKIPQAERTAELAAVPLVLADCLIRQAPTAAPDDALAAGKLEEQLKGAADLLDAFVAATPNGPQTPDALLKLGLCQQRLATLQAQPKDRQKVLQTARQTYEKLLQAPFAKLPTGPAAQAQAVFERAKIFALMNDPGRAINEMKRFENDPLRQAPIAPMALIQLSTLLRAQNRQQEAVAILANARPFYETVLARDPQRAPWIQLLRYHQGMALREQRKWPEARAVLGLVVQEAAGKAEGAEAALRVGQCFRDEAQKPLDAARKALAAARSPEDFVKAMQAKEQALPGLREAAAFLENQAEMVKQKLPELETRARMYYDLAWTYRDLADLEIAAARAALLQEWRKKEGNKPALEWTLAKLPLQPAEQKARAAHEALISNFAELPLAVDARFELAEYLNQRDNSPAIAKLLIEALDKEPPPELTEKIRLRLGASLAQTGKLEPALAQFKAIAHNAKSPHLGQAKFRAGECLLLLNKADEAVKQLTVFRDQGQYQNVPDVSDRALFRLGEAYAQLKQWEPSRQSFEVLTQRHQQSPLVHEARYGAGWALQQMGQFDGAVNTYAKVTADTLTETGAKAQLQAGLCRMAQKRYKEAATLLLVVPNTYDYKEPCAVALLEAARAYVELKEPAEAARLLERVVRDFPNSPWAEAARERLTALKGAK